MNFNSLDFLLTFYLLFVFLQYLFVLQGCFEVRGVNGEIQLQAASETKIDNGVFYEITNKGKKTGIIQFEYSEQSGDASEEE